MKLSLPKIVFSLALVLTLVQPVLANLETDLLRYRSEQDRLQKLIDQAKSQENTLATQISILNNQISLTQLDIGATQAELNIKEGELSALNADIGDLSDRIGNLESDLNRLASTAVKRFRINQAIEMAQPFGAMVISGDIGGITTDLTYAEYIRQHDQVLFGQMRDVKSALAVQRTSLQDKQTQVQKIRDEIKAKNDQLLAYKAQLDGQKNDKARLLAVTKNSEANYQKLLAQVKSEINSIQVALMGGGVKLGYVQAGDVVAHQGNTGCSTGTHLHFGSFLNGVVYNPKPNLDSGFFRWPEISPRVTQWYGDNYWWYMTYFGRPGHDGIDMQSGSWPNSGFGSPIYAAKAGTAYLSVESQPCSFTGTRGRGIVIDHGLGQKTIYWHVQ